MSRRASCETPPAPPASHAPLEPTAPPRAAVSATSRKSAVAAHSPAATKAWHRLLPVRGQRPPSSALRPGKRAAFCSRPHASTRYTGCSRLIPAELAFSAALHLPRVTTMVTFGAEQYHWHPEGAKSHADPDGPAARTTLSAKSGEVVTLAKASVTVLRGKIG